MYVIPRIECNWGRKREAGRAMLMATRPYTLLFELNVYICNFSKITFTEVTYVYRMRHLTTLLNQHLPWTQRNQTSDSPFSLTYAFTSTQRQLRIITCCILKFNFLPVFVSFRYHCPRLVRKCWSKRLISLK